MGLLKETWELGKLLFTKFRDSLEIRAFKYYPLDYAVSWCGILVCREKNLERIKADEDTKRHETIHLYQAKTGYKCWIEFYLSYLWNVLSGAVYGLSWDFGYYTSKFEWEAYANEGRPEYLESYRKDSIKKYNFSLSQRKELWDECSRSRRKWKEAIKKYGIQS
jgi:hypothetical protein